MPLFRTPSRNAKPPDKRFRLDTPLVPLSKQDRWTIADACEGTQIFGAAGSGKTSGSGQAIAKAMLRNGFGGLVLTAKPDERMLWERYAAETGRTESVLVFGIDGVEWDGALGEWVLGAIGCDESGVDEGLC